MAKSNSNSGARAAMTPSAAARIQSATARSTGGTVAKGSFAEDVQANSAALRYGYRVLSSYEIGSGQKLWIITEADRSATTLLLPEEY